MPTPPAQPKIYHIVHVDRLSSIIADGGLHCDATVVSQRKAGTMIGIDDIKRRRLQSQISSRPGLRVGDCVPFYFCPRSVMLYIIHCANHPNLAYRGGQEPIIHLEGDFTSATSWANANSKRWAFTLSNAGSTYFEDRADRRQLTEIDWQAVTATQWGDSAVKEGKQAEFLIEERLPWVLIERIGVYSTQIANRVALALPSGGHRPTVQVLGNWYY